MQTNKTSTGGKPNPREERIVFNALEKLCRSSGYIHAIAYFCFRDNFFRYDQELTGECLQATHPSAHLIRAEISTLIGLLIKHPISFEHPGPPALQSYIDRTEELLNELHQAIFLPFTDAFKSSANENARQRGVYSGQAIREPIFYGGESAYAFQYRDFAPRKYHSDTEWLVANRGFSIEQAKTVACAISEILLKKLPATAEEFKKSHPDTWTILPGFTFCENEVARNVEINCDTVHRILSAFTLPADERNIEFLSIGDFNVISAFPLIRKPSGELILFQGYEFLQAIYELWQKNKVVSRKIKFYPEK